MLELNFTLSLISRICNFLSFSPLFRRWRIDCDCSDEFMNSKSKLVVKDSNNYTCCVNLTGSRVKCKFNSIICHNLQCQTIRQLRQKHCFLNRIIGLTSLIYFRNDWQGNERWFRKPISVKCQHLKQNNIFFYLNWPNAFMHFRHLLCVNASEADFWTSRLKKVSKVRGFSATIF